MASNTQFQGKIQAGALKRWPANAIIPLRKARRNPGIITALANQVVRAASEAQRLNYQTDDFAGWLDTLDPRLRKHAPAAFTAVPRWAGEMTQRLLVLEYLWTSSRDGWNPEKAARLRGLFTAAGLAGLCRNRHPSRPIPGSTSWACRKSLTPIGPGASPPV